MYYLHWIDIRNDCASECYWFPFSSGHNSSAAPLNSPVLMHFLVCCSEAQLRNLVRAFALHYACFPLSLYPSSSLASFPWAMCWNTQTACCQMSHSLHVHAHSNTHFFLPFTSLTYKFLTLTCLGCVTLISRFLFPLGHSSALPQLCPLFLPLLFCLPVSQSVVCGWDWSPFLVICYCTSLFVFHLPIKRLIFSSCVSYCWLFHCLCNSLCLSAQLCWSPHRASVQTPSLSLRSTESLICTAFFFFCTAPTPHKHTR